ncbi:hypothetical protein V8E36_002992 [Tilletia maclaganii]
MALPPSQLTVASSSSTMPSSSQTSFHLENYQEDCDSEYLEALEAVADAEVEDGGDDSYFFELVAEAERQYPKDVLDGMIKDLKQRGLVHFVQTYAIQRRVDIKVLLIALNVCLPRALLDQDVPDVKLIPVLKSALSRILRKRQRLTQYSTPNDVVKLLQNARKIIILSGAGISVSVGIPDFRSMDGIYAQLQREGKYHLDDPTDMFDKRFFQRDPTCFYDFVHSLWPSAFTPSPTHFFIKLLEDRGQLLRDYTQNIDTLEHQAGIKRVLPCHGSFATASCTEVGCTYKCKGEDISSAVFQRRVPLCPRCNATLIDEGKDKDEDDAASPSELAASTKAQPRKDAPAKLPGVTAGKAGSHNKKSKSRGKKGWGPGESEEDSAEDEVWVQGGRAGVGLSATHALTEILGAAPKKSPGSSSSSPMQTKTESPQRPLRRSASGRLVESPLQAGAGPAQRHWKGVIKPDVVFFGEKLPDEFDKLLLEDRDQVDLLLVMGTSLKVAPVSELVSHIPHSTPVVLINRTPVTHVAMDVQLLGDADEIIGWLCRRLGWELPGPHSVHGKRGSGEVVPASQADEKILRAFEAEYQPRQAGNSPIWLWPNAQGGRVVDYLENGAKLDEFGRLTLGFDPALDDEDDDDDGGADAGDDDAEVPVPAYTGFSLPADLRYLPPGVVHDSQASTSPAHSHVSGSRPPTSPPFRLQHGMSEDRLDLLGRLPSDAEAQRHAADVDGMTETSLPMRADAAAGSRAELDVLLGTRPKLAAGNSDVSLNSAAGRRQREAEEQDGQHADADGRRMDGVEGSNGSAKRPKM